MKFVKSIFLLLIAFLSSCSSNEVERGFVFNKKKDYSTSDFLKLAEKGNDSALIELAKDGRGIAVGKSIYSDPEQGLIRVVISKKRLKVFKFLLENDLIVWTKENNQSGSLLYELLKMNDSRFFIATYKHFKKNNKDLQVLSGEYHFSLIPGWMSCRNGSNGDEQFKLMRFFLDNNLVELNYVLNHVENTQNIVRSGCLEALKYIVGRGAKLNYTIEKDEKVFTAFLDYEEYKNEFDEDFKSYILMNTSLEKSLVLIREYWGKKVIGYLDLSSIVYVRKNARGNSIYRKKSFPVYHSPDSFVIYQKNGKFYDYFSTGLNHDDVALSIFEKKGNWLQIRKQENRKYYWIKFKYVEKNKITEVLGRGVNTFINVNDWPIDWIKVSDNKIYRLPRIDSNSTYIDDSHHQVKVLERRKIEGEQWIKVNIFKSHESIEDSNSKIKKENDLKGWIKRFDNNNQLQTGYYFKD